MTITTRPKQQHIVSVRRPSGPIAKYTDTTITAAVRRYAIEHCTQHERREGVEVQATLGGTVWSFTVEEFTTLHVTPPYGGD